MNTSTNVERMFTVSFYEDSSDKQQVARLTGKSEKEALSRFFNIRKTREEKYHNRAKIVAACATEHRRDEGCHWCGKSCYWCGE